MADYIPMLPEIDKNSKAFQDIEAGIWSDNIETLESLVDSLATGGSLEDVGNIDSIPDVWAKPLLFKMALFDLETTKEFVAGLHDRVLGEWRAILAMLALKNVKQLNLKALSVNLNEDHTEMSKVLKALAPKESLNGNEAAWLTDIYVIFYNDLPLAMTSPTTLVASAADYSSTFKGVLDLPWSKDKKTLTDPVKYLSRTELVALNAWLKKLYDELQNLSRGLNSSSQDIAINLLKCVRDYQEDVSREVGAGNSETSLEFISSNLNLHMGLSRLLDETVKGKEANAEDSAVKLIVNTSRSNRKLLLVSPEMAKALARQEGVDPARLVVWQGISANDITEKSLQGERNKIGQITLKGVEFRRPEDFFYDKMAVVEPGNAFPGSLEISGAIALADDALTPVLPIKRELLEIFSPQEIVSRLSISDDADNISLHFNFPLSGVDGGGVDFRFTKTYPKRDLIYIQQEVPVIEIWPNIRRKNWDKYYLYYENYQAQATNKGAADALVDEMYYVEPFTFGHELEKDFPAQGLKNCFTAKLNHFPEALICNYKTQNLATAASEIGIILLNPPETVQREAGLTWKIGVDFGTSSTMLYYSESKKQPAPLDFSPRLFKVTESGGARSQTFINFIASNPPTRPDGSFLSIFHLLNTTDIQQEIRPLQDGHVFTLLAETLEDQFLLDATSANFSDFDFNLKWQSANAGRYKVSAYVRQICMQSLAEAAYAGVEAVKWNFSFPTAFSQEKLESFKSICSNAVENICNETCFAADLKIKWWEESKATAYHFSNLGYNFVDGAICIDIGAGTTDVSFISERPARIIYNTSFQFAGRYLFSPIYNNYEKFITHNLDLSTKYDKEQKNAFIDADIREHGDEYINHLSYITGNFEVANVLQKSQFAITAIFYYIGMILGELHSRKIYKENHAPDIYVGGNGSRIFHWITGGMSEDINSSPYIEVLKNALLASSNLSDDNNFKIKLSSNPKVEVARGMVLDPLSNDEEFFNEKRQLEEMFGRKVDKYIANSILSGEEYKVADELKEKNSFISAGEISEGITSVNSNELKKVIEIFNDEQRVWADGIEFTENMERDIKKSLNSEYVSQKGKEKKEIFVEPVFVMEVKKFMEMF